MKVRIDCWWGLAVILAVSCGSGAPTADDVGTGVDGGTTPDASARNSGSVGADAASDARASSSQTSDSSTMSSDGASTMASVGAPMSLADSSTPVDSGGAITGLTPDTWQWVPFADAFCRDGTTTGIGVSPSPGSTKLLFFLDQGGACFNATTCQANASHFGASDFQALLANGTPGIFNRSDPANPVADWNMVYVPYCTGDVHAGNQPNGVVPGVSGTQAFVGYANVGAYLARVIPTFPGLDQVLLAGQSAGGFGAMANYLRVARAFGSVPVTLLDDSGPFMDTPYIATCLSQLWVSTWGLDTTLLADCGSTCANDGHYLINYAKKAVGSYSGVAFGLVDSTDDDVITQFFGFGADNCADAVPPALSASTFTAGLDDIRGQLATDSNFGAYIFSGTRHTTLQDATDFDTQTVPVGDGASVSLTSWIARLVAGSASNAGP